MGDIFIYSKLLDTAPSNQIYCKGASLTYALKQLTKTDALANSFTLAEAQTSGIENPKLVLTGYIDTNNLTSNSIKQTDILKLLKTPYDGTSNTEIRIFAETGKGILVGTNKTYLYGFDGTTNYIKVIIDSIDISIDPSNSAYGHLWVYNMNLTETL